MVVPHAGCAQEQQQVLRCMDQGHGFVQRVGQTLALLGHVAGKQADHGRCCREQTAVEVGGEITGRAICGLPGLFDEIRGFGRQSANPLLGRCERKLVGRTCAGWFTHGLGIGGGVVESKLESEASVLS